MATANYDINRHREDIRNFTTSMDEHEKKQHKNCYSIEVIAKYLDQRYAPVSGDLEKQLNQIKEDLDV